MTTNHVAGSTVYVAGSTNDELVAGLRDPNAAQRTKNAKTIGVLHVYVALPELLDTARSDPDADVRQAARQAVIDLSPSEDAADRAIAGHAPAGGGAERTPQKEQATAVVALFETYREARTAAFNALVKDHAEAKSTAARGPEERDLVGPIIDYMGAWGGRSASDLDEVGLAAAKAVGAITRFIEIPPRDAGCKSMSFKDAIARVAQYKAILAKKGETGI